jgi:hypothetical protein
LTDCKSCERMASAETKIKNLEAVTNGMDKKVEAVDSKVDGLKNWIIGLLGTSILSLILLVANLVSKGAGH